MTSAFQRAATRLKGAIAALRSNTDGLAALEFAMVVPIMVSLFLGAVEFSEALTVDRRVTAVASSVADLIAQEKEVTDSELEDIMTIADSLLAGVDTEPLWVEIISVVVDAAGTATVDWSYDKGGGSPYGTGQSYPKLPQGFRQPNPTCTVPVCSSVVIAQVEYEFVPKIGHYIVGSIGLSERFYLRPRQSLKVAKK